MVLEATENIHKKPYNELDLYLFTQSTYRKMLKYPTGNQILDQRLMDQDFTAVQVLSLWIIILFHYVYFSTVQDIAI